MQTDNENEKEVAIEKKYEDAEEEEGMAELAAEEAEDLIKAGMEILKEPKEEKKRQRKSLAETLGVIPQGKKDEKTEKPYGRII